MILSVELLTMFTSLICFELTQYSTCFEIINQITPEQKITVIEVSPTPGGAILILALHEADKNIEKFESFYKQQQETYKHVVLQSCFINNFKNEILAAYLSQNSVPEINELCFFESDSLCEAFNKAQEVVLQGTKLIDFRTLRSVQNKAFLIFTQPYQSTNLNKITVITEPNDLIKSYFQILK